MRKLVSYLTFIGVIVFSLLSVTSCKTNNDDKAKYIFLFIGDGMGLGQVSLAESYLSYQDGKIGGASLSFTQFPVYGFCTTYSADHHITCSAAAGTAIACGEKTNNGFVGVNPAGDHLESVAGVLKKEGYKVGIMTNVQVNHATPATFYAHQSDRNNYYEICQELPLSGFEFFGGSGFYKPCGKNGDREPLGEYVEGKGYEVCYGVEEFDSIKDSADRVVFIQESGRKGDTDFYESNGVNEGDISLGAMMNLALDFLGDDEPFFIMCEGGGIDWAGHHNKTVEIIRQVLDLEDAVDAALEFYSRHPDETLILVTADHETGGLVLGQGYEPGAPENFRWNLIEEQWRESKGRKTLPFEENRTLNNSVHIGWTTNHHTAMPVPLYAKGKGAERFGGRLDNTEIKNLILGNF